MTELEQEIARHAAHGAYTRVIQLTDGEHRQCVCGAWYGPLITTAWAVMVSRLVAQRQHWKDRESREQAATRVRNRQLGS